MATAALIPALDCEPTIAGVVEGASRHVDHVLVVDDGSSDRTSEVARGAGATVLHHETNLGKGAALLDGMRSLAEGGFDHVLTLDGDGQHLPGEIPKLLGESAVHPTAIVIGARRVEGKDVAPLKLFANRFANLWIELAAGVPIRDTQSGFRVYPLRETLALEPQGRHFEFESEVLILAARRGLAIRSVPVEVYYPPAGKRKSHYGPFVDTVRIIEVVLRLLLWR